MPVEYDCEGCGSHIYNAGYDKVPKTGLCLMCAWLCEHVPDPEAMMVIRKHGLPETYNVLPLSSRSTFRRQSGE